MTKSLRVLIVVVAMAAITFSLLASEPSGCTYECRSGVDGSTGNLEAWCLQYSFDQHDMAGCQVSQNCWYAWFFSLDHWYMMRVCDNPTCFGTMCYNV